MRTDAVRAGAAVFDHGVQSRSGGPRVLQIGRAFGESKRRYARVADAKRTDVFLISESDAAKIVRDVAAFAKE